MTENVEATALWKRASKALETAKGWVKIDPDAACSRAYYAAFYAVSALLLIEGKSYKRHTAVEVAVHRDLVQAGRWDESLGKAYTSLRTARATGDYGGTQHLSAEQAAKAWDRATRVLVAVHEQKPEFFTDPPTG